MAESLRILILEDNPADAELVQFELEEAGFVFTAMVVTTRKDFVHELRAFSPDLILSDYDLPQFNGVLALAEAKKRCPDIPFILVTGAIVEDRAIEILTQGAKDYVLKTKLQQRLAPAVKRALAEAGEIRARKQAEEKLREAHQSLEVQVAQRTAELQKQIQRRSQIEEALLKYNERLELLSYTASRLLASDKPQQLIEELCLKVMEFLDCQAFFNFLVDEVTGRLHLNACAGIEPEAAREIEWLDFGVAVCGCVARDGSRIVAENIPETPDVRTELIKSFGIKAYACHPLMQQKHVIGTLSFGTRARTTFSADDVAMMKAVADQVAIAMFRVHTEEALRESERHERERAEELATMLEATPIPVIIVHDAGATHMTGNRTANELLRQPQGAEVSLSAPSEVKPCHYKAMKDGHELRLEELPAQRAARGEHVKDFEFSLVFNDGATRHLLGYGTPLLDKHHQTRGAVHVLLDITERKNSEKELEKLNRTLRALNKSNQAMIRATDERGYIEEICKIVVEDCGYTMVWVGFAENDEGKTVRPAAFSGFEKGYIDTLKITWADTERGRGPTGTAIRTGKPTVCRNMLTDPRFKPWREEAIKRGYASSIVLPLVFGGKAFGALTIYAKEPDSFTQDEANLLIELSNDFSYGIMTIRLSKARLEAEEALRESEERFHAIATNTPDHILMQDRDLRYQLVINPQLGLTEAGMQGKTDHDILAKDDAERITAIKRKVLETGNRVTVESSLLNLKGETEFFEGVYVPKFGPAGLIDGLIGYFRNVTERKRAEVAVRESEERLHFALETIHTGAWDMDLVDHSSFRSLEHDRIFGYSHLLPEWTYEMFLDHVLPEDRAMVDSKFRQAQENKSDWNFECRIRRTDGQVRWIWAAGRHTQNAAGAPGRMAGIVQDITERKQGEEALRESEEKFRMLAESSTFAIIMHQGDRWIYANPAAGEISGYTKGDLDGMHFWDIVHPDHREMVKQRGLDRQQGKVVPSTYELKIITKNGEEKWVSLTGSTIQYKDKPTVLISIIDITERKLVEEKLRESEHLYRAIGESIDYGIWVCDSDGRNIYASESFLKLVGMTQDQCSNFGWGDVLHPDDAKRAIAAWKECVLTGSNLDIEHRFRGVDGQWHSVLARGTPVRNEQGEIIFWAGINLDISNLKRAEMALNERTQQLEEANRELESFSYSISHDLKAPLRAIDGFSRKLEREYGDKLDDKLAGTINVIRSNTRLMAVLIDNLLSFSRVQKIDMNISAIDMDKLAVEVWNEILEANKKRKFNLKISKILPGYGDRILIRQVLFNLFSNAVKFTKNKKQGIIEMSSYIEADKVVYCLKDNGAGFDMEYYDKLFGVFQRLHSAEEYEGTGVGLAIVQRIIMRHGGRIWAEGKVDKGAAFYFTLPRQMTNP